MHMQSYLVSAISWISEANLSRPLLFHQLSEICAFLVTGYRGASYSIKEGQMFCVGGSTYYGGRLVF